MGRELYETEPVYRATLDDCAEQLTPFLGHDLRQLLFDPATDIESLARTEFAQPALFSTELALAELYRSWGLTPRATLGHSLGEFVAATLAGVFTRADALRLVATRGRLMQSMAPGAMLSVALGEAELIPYLNKSSPPQP